MGSLLASSAPDLGTDSPLCPAGSTAPHCQHSQDVPASTELTNCRHLRDAASHRVSDAGGLTGCAGHRVLFGEKRPLFLLVSDWPVCREPSRGRVSAAPQAVLSYLLGHPSYLQGLRVETSSACLKYQLRQSKKQQTKPTVQRLHPLGTLSNP